VCKSEGGETADVETLAKGQERRDGAEPPCEGCVVMVRSKRRFGSGAFGQGQLHLYSSIAPSAALGTSFDSRM